MTPYGDLAVKAVIGSYRCNWHLRQNLFEKENDKDLAVKAVTGSYEGYWTLVLNLFKKIFGHNNLPKQYETAKELPNLSPPGEVFVIERW